MDKFKVLKMSKEDLENSIAGLSGLKPILQQQVIKGNGSDKKQGQTDAKELGEHFETAINSMVTVLALIESKEEKFNDLISRSNENEKLKADIRGKENEIEVLKWRVKYLSQFKPKEHEEQYKTFLEINNFKENS